MKNVIVAAAIVLGLAASTAARAQTSEISGKVLDATGSPVAGATVSAANKDFPDRVYKATTDKKGSYFLAGLLYAAQSPLWNLSIAAEGFVPQSVKLVARTGDKTLYFEDTVMLSAKATSAEIKLKAFAEIRADFTMRPGDVKAELEALPAPAPPGGAPETAGAAAAAAPGAAADTYEQAIAKVRAGDAEGSVDLFKKAIEEKPDDWERRDLFAKVLLRLDRQGEATIQANKAVLAAPDKAGPLLTLTDIYLARSLPDKAADAIGKAQQLEPDNPKVLERAATVAAGAGKIDEAIALNEKVLATKPDSTEVLVALADLYNRKKQPKKAEEMLNRVVALDPKNAHRTFYNLGVVIENRDDVSPDDHRKAIEAFRKAVDLKPDYAIAHRDLGFALLRTGDMAEARKELQKYVDLDPRARDAAEIQATVKSLAQAK